MNRELTYSSTHLDKKEIEELFKSYFGPLCSFAQKYVKDHDSAKEIVHDVFINLWEKRDELHMKSSLKSYLFKSVHNRCLNYLRDQKKFDQNELSEENISAYGSVAYTDHLEEAELQQKINQALDFLPEKCREIFILSRFEELKYKEIAGRLNVSVKTVETQMSKALKILREKLTEYLKLIIFIILLLK